MGGLLEGKKVLVTGVLDRRSIAYSVARLAQEQGAELVLSGFGRARSLTERTARRLDPEPSVLELDVNKPEDVEAVAGALGERWGELDGIVHAIAFADRKSTRLNSSHANIYTLSLHDALPICWPRSRGRSSSLAASAAPEASRSERPDASTLNPPSSNST